MEKKQNLCCLTVLIWAVFIFNCAQASVTKEHLVRRIVPEPKVVEPYDTNSLTLLPSEITIIYGASSPKTKIGAEEINKELHRQGLSGRMKIVSDAEYTKGNEKLFIVVGSPEENTITKKLWENVRKREELKEMNEQGYIIDYAQFKQPAIVLVGMSPQGSLYACITFMQMLDVDKEKVVVHNAFVKDWPDFKWRYFGHPAFYLNWTSDKAAYPNEPVPDMTTRGKEYMDWMLRYKINVFRVQLWWGWSENAEAEKHWRNFMAYGKQRGIMSYMGCPEATQAVGYRKNWGEFDKIKNDPKYKGLTNISPRFRKYKHFITWSRDDLLEEKFRAFGKKCKDWGIDITWFHAVDTGLGSFNYAKWKDRDELDKKKWGNDYGHADAHVMNLAYKILKEESPETRIIFVTYPYSASVLSDDFPQKMLERRGKTINEEDAKKERDFIRNYFKIISEEAPNDIWFCQRESSPKDTKLWVEATKRPIMIYYDTFTPFCSSRARFIKTWFSKEYDNFYFWPSAARNYISGLEMPVRMLLHAEYSWNTEQEGSGLYEGKDFGKDYFEPKEVFDEIIPRTCRAYWGDQAGQYWAKLFQGGLVPKFIDNPMTFLEKELKIAKGDLVKILEAEGNVVTRKGGDRFSKPLEEMQRQQKYLESVLPGLENWLTNYKLKENDPFTYRYGTTLYLLANYWYHKASAWIPYLELEQAVAQKKVENSKQLAMQGRKSLRNAKESIEQVVTKIAAHPVLIPTIKGKRLDEKIIKDFSQMRRDLQKLYRQAKEIESRARKEKLHKVREEREKSRS